MNLRTVRYRGNMGEPRSKLEICLQRVYHWRIEVIIVYIAITSTIAVLYEVLGR